MIILEIDTNDLALHNLKRQRQRRLALFSVVMSPNSIKINKLFFLLQDSTDLKSISSFCFYTFPLPFLTFSTGKYVQCGLINPVSKKIFVLFCLF